MSSCSLAVLVIRNTLSLHPSQDNEPEGYADTIFVPLYMPTYSCLTQLLRKSLVSTNTPVAFSVGDPAIAIMTAQYDK